MHADAMRPWRRTRRVLMGGDDGRAHSQASTHAGAVCDPHLAVVYHPEEPLEDALAELRWDARASTPSRHRVDLAPDTVLCLDTVTRPTPTADEYCAGAWSGTYWADGCGP